MFHTIQQHEELYGLIKSCCVENGIGVNLDRALLAEDGFADPDKVLILKMDAFYSTTRMPDPPPSIDCLIIVKCTETNSYDIYLVELRNTSSTRNARAKDIVPKFKTALEDFLGTRFGNLLLPTAVQINTLRLFLVTNPLRAKNTDQYRRLIKGTVLDAYGSLPPLVFRDKVLVIEPVLPDPAIAAC